MLEWVVALSGLAIIACLIMITCCSWQLQLRWRKPWMGPLAVRLRVYSPQQWWSFTFDRHSRVILSIQQWIWPARRRSPTHFFRQGRRTVSVLSRLGPAFSIVDWTTQTQFGFDDPSLTGECLGLLAAMPRTVQTSISITFERVGCRTSGYLDVTVRPIHLLGRLIVVWVERIKLSA